MAPMRRDRRTAAANSGRPIRSKSPARATRTGPFDGRRRLFLNLIFLSFLLGASVALYRYRNRNRFPSDTSPPVLSVYDRGLVKPDINYQEIIRESGKVSDNRSHRHFPNPVLAYVTPWNSRGYDMAKLFCSKFTHLSPVWYDLKSEGNKLVLDGRHNADMGWISELRAGGPSLVLPRVVLEAFPAGLLQKKQQRSKAIDIIVTECNGQGHGI